MEGLRRVIGGRDGRGDVILLVVVVLLMLLLEGWG